MSALVTALATSRARIVDLGRQQAALAVDGLEAAALRLAGEVPELARDVTDLVARAGLLAADGAAGTLRVDDAQAASSDLLGAALIVARTAEERGARETAAALRAAVGHVVAFASAAIQVGVAGVVQGLTGGLGSSTR